jgi:fatty acid synthase
MIIKCKWCLFQGVIVENPVVITVTAQNCDWLPQVQAAVSSSSTRRIILVAQGEPLSGILGFVNCIRKEPECDLVRLDILFETFHYL